MKDFHKSAVEALNAFNTVEDYLSRIKSIAPGIVRTFLEECAAMPVTELVHEVLPPEEAAKMGFNTVFTDVDKYGPEHTKAKPNG